MTENHRTIKQCKNKGICNVVMESGDRREGMWCQSRSVVRHEGKRNALCERRFC